MKVYQVYAGSVVVYTCKTRGLAQYLCDWCAAEYEHSYREIAKPYLSMYSTVMNQIENTYYVMEVTVLE